MNRIADHLAEFGLTVQNALPLVIGVGVFILVWGIAALVRPQVTPEQRRIRAVVTTGNTGRVVRLLDNDPTGALRLFVPRSGKERSRIALKLRQAGIHKASAVRDFFLIRSLFSLILPTLFIALTWFQDLLPAELRDLVLPLSRLTTTQVFQGALALVALGFYSPLFWLRHKVEKRQLEITRGLPNALDLLQVAVEAGMGLDAAMTRVAHELSKVCAPISQEFTILQLEIQAGKPRERAFAELERRTGVEEMASFANVILQSAEFGTPVADALTTYAVEMRFSREMKAQEQANKLPVKMSGILAGCMMPVLLLITCTPVAIRWVRMMSG